MSSEQFASVWDAIAEMPAEAENMKLRSALMIALEQQSKLRAGLRLRPPAGSA